VKAEMNSLPRESGSEAAHALERKIHDMLFVDVVEEEHVHV
jgi:hypothetical protein